MSVDRGHCRETVVLKAKYDAALTFIESRRVQPSDCIFWNHGRRDDDAHGGEDKAVNPFEHDDRRPVGHGLQRNRQRPAEAEFTPKTVQVLPTP